MTGIGQCQFGLIGAWSASNILTFGLWLGLCVLTVWLLILTRTKWGGVKTTNKCIWLSVFAHILLVIYACKTNILFPSLGSGDDEAIIPITFIPDSEDSLDVAKDSAEDLLPTPTLQVETQTPIDLQAPNLLETQRVDDSPPANAMTITAPPLVKPTTPDPVSTPPTDPPDAEVTSDATENPEFDSSTESIAPEMTAQQKPVESIADSSSSAPTDRVTLGQPNPIDTDANSETTVKDSTTSQSSEATFRPAFQSIARPNAEVYALRDPEHRQQNALARGGTESSEAAVDRALEWLVANQQADGRWDPRRTGAGQEFKVMGHDRHGAGGDADTAITGLALLALMGAGHDHLRGEYRENVRKGLEFILRSQSPSGHLAGEASLFAHMYSHGIATLAVSEAYALTGDTRLKPYVDRAVAYSLAAQNARTGGWRYQPGEEGDMSQFGWQVMALKSAQVGGASIPAITVQRMKNFLDLCSSGEHMGLASYRPRQQPSPTMTAEALSCRYFLGQSVPGTTADESAAFILRSPPGSGETDYYLWYYATLSLYQKGGSHWEEWNRHMQRELVRTQVLQGEHAGSWEPNGKWCGYGGRVFSTALATMCLEVYYRYLPMMREQVAWK